MYKCLCPKYPVLLDQVDCARADVVSTVVYNRCIIKCTSKNITPDDGFHEMNVQICFLIRFHYITTSQPSTLPCTQLPNNALERRRYSVQYDRAEGQTWRFLYKKSLENSGYHRG